MNLNRCQFADSAYSLRCITKKLPTLMSATLMTIEDDNEPKDISCHSFDALFGKTCVHPIDAMTLQLTAKFSCGTAER
jgi:hypothetical protein